MKKTKFRPKRNIDGPGGNTNGQRAQWGENTLRHYFLNELHGRPTDELEDYNFSDLISDLGHFADKGGRDFKAIIGSALRRWEEER